jgi:hypothetical protein
MNETTGFLATRALSLIHLAAASSSEPPISPMRIIPSVWGSSAKSFSTSTKLVPLKGSPPIPTQVDWPRPTAVV